MCYDIQSKLESQLKRARRLNQADVIRELENELEPYLTQWYHANGFAHPSLLIYPATTPAIPIPANWGLIPHWVKDEQQAKSIQQKTINARGESIFDKPSFRDAAKLKRCMISVDGFFEHQHKNGKAIPYFIQRQDEEPMNLAGLWSEWINKQTGAIERTFTIVTCKANPMMAQIHNNPKLKEARMPLLLSEKSTEVWLGNTNREEIQELIIPSKEALKAHTVKPLRGKQALGNVKEVSMPYQYESTKKLFGE
jgi:putative SOS response-associated peptidase YedK